MHIHPLGVAVISQVVGQGKGKVCGVCRRQLCRALAGGAQVEDMGLRDVILAQIDGAGVALCIIAHRAAISYAVHALDGRVGDDRDGVQIGVNVEGGGFCVPNTLHHAIDAVDVFFSVLGILRCSVVQGVVIRSAVQVFGFLCHQRVDDGVILNDAALIIDNGALAAVNDGLVTRASRIFHWQLQGALTVFDRAAVADHGSAGVTGAVIAAVQHSLIGSHVDYRISGNIQRRVADGSGLRRVAPAVADVVKAQHRILHKAVIVKALRAVQLGIRDDAALPIVHIPGGVQRTAEGAVVFNRKFYCTGLICHLVEVQHSALLDGQGGDIVCKQFCVLVVRFKGPAVALGTIDAAVRALGEAVLFNDQFLYGNAVELDSFSAHSKADCAVLGSIVQLVVAAGNTFQLAGGLQGDTGIGSDIEGTISICRPRGHRAVRCHCNRGIHRVFGCIDLHETNAFCREIAAIDGCFRGQRGVFSGEQTAVDGAILRSTIQKVLEQAAVDGDCCRSGMILDSFFKAAAVDDDSCSRIFDLHGAARTARKGAAVDGKGIHRIGEHGIFKRTAVNSDLAARGVHGNVFLKGAAADDSPGFTDHLAVEGAAGDSACVGHGVAVMVFRADPRLLQGGTGLDLYVPLDAIIVAVIAVIAEPEGAVFQGERIAGLIVGPAAFAAAEGVAGGLARPVIWKDIGDIVVFLCQCGGAGGVGRGALGKGGQRHCGQCHAQRQNHADEPFLHKILSFLSALPSRAFFVVPSVPRFARFGRFWARIAPQMR